MGIPNSDIIFHAVSQLVQFFEDQNGLSSQLKVLDKAGSKNDVIHNLIIHAFRGRIQVCVTFLSHNGIFRGYEFKGGAIAPRDQKISFFKKH